MSGINRASKNYKGEYSTSRKKSGIKCVFLSHQKRDKEICRKIADYLLNANIDVYFDEFDEDLKNYLQENNPQGVVDSIRIGINNSSHMLVVISLNSIHSQWVPWEIGYGYDKTYLGVLCLKNIPKGTLPEYIRTAKIIRDIYDLNILISTISGKSKETLLESKMMSDYNSYDNPLTSFMDNLISEKY